MNRRGRADRWWAVMCLGVFATLLAVQLFGPHAIGMADNGDFNRVTSRIGVTANVEPKYRYFGYFVPDQLRGPLRPGEGWAYSQILVGKLASALDARRNGHFDLRWAGFVQGAALVLCFGLLLRVLRSAPWATRVGVPALCCWIFGDVFYAAYLNSFYGDALGFICFLAMVLALWTVLTGNKPIWSVLLFGIAAGLFALAKPANTVVAVALACFLGGIGVFRLRSAARVAAGFTAVAVAAVGCWGAVIVPQRYSYTALLDVVMVRIATTPHGREALADFGLPSSDLRYAGMNFFTHAGPGSDPAFYQRFSHVTTIQLARWLALHPTVTARFLIENLINDAPGMRATLGNFQIESGHARAARTDRFASWSNLRARLLWFWPWYIPCLYSAALAVSSATLVRRRWRSNGAFALLLGMLCVVGILQFCLGSLLDTIETKRHLFLFHMTTDTMLLLLAAGALSVIRSDRPSQRI